MRITLVCFLFSFCSLFVVAQRNQNSMDSIELQLADLLVQLRTVKKDVEKKAVNDTFKLKFAEALAHEDAFDYPFQRLKSVGKIHSQDNEVAVISWNIEWEDKSHHYYAFILKKDKRKPIHHVIPLEDKSYELPPQPKEQLDAENWYGCLYYAIKDVQKGRRTYYTLFGYDANNERSTIKLLDVLYFTGKTPRFGYPLFEVEDGYANRVYFEHASKAVMSLNYDKKREMIIFDHLSPETPSLHEFREYYVPDMSYDGYIFEDKKWRLREDVIAVNKSDDKQAYLHKYDADKDTVVRVPAQKKWEDPSDPDAPIQSYGHKAVLPDDQRSEKDEKSSKKKSVDKNKTPKGEFKGVSFSNLPDKKDKKKKKKNKDK